jgi:ribonuclease HII
MVQLGAEHPQYAFEKHKGYGTALHYERIREHGPCPLHRHSFLKNLQQG